MRTVNINFTLTDSEHEFLVAGKCDKPNADRIKMMLLREAAKNLRYWSESVLQSADPHTRTVPAHIEPRGVIRTARKVEVQAKPKTAVGPLGHGGKHKLPPKPARAPRADMEALIEKSSRPRAEIERDIARKTGDGGWMDDDNLRKLRQHELKHITKS